MQEILTKEGKLTIFENNIIVDKRLPKWREAENGLKKTDLSQNNATRVVNVENEDISTYIIGTPDVVMSNGSNHSNDIDSNVNASTKWLPLYEIADGVNFDDYDNTDNWD